MTRALLGRRTRVRVTPLAMLRATLPAVGVVAVLAAVVAGVAADAATALGVLAGAALVAASYTVGTAVLALADRTDPGLVLPVGLAVYAATVLVLGGLLAVLVDEPRTGAVAGLPWGVVAGVLAWGAAHAWWWWTAPVPYVEMPPTP